MRKWLARQLEPVDRSTRPVAVVIDPEDAVRTEDVDHLGEVAIARSSWELRRIFEAHGRHRSVDAPRLVLVVKATELQERRDLPWDIEQSTAVAEVRVPGPPSLRDVVLGLADDLSDRAAQVLETTVDPPLTALLRAIWGVDPPNGQPVRELDLVVRLRSDPRVPEAIWGLLHDQLLRWPPARALCTDPPDAGPLQAAWAAWVQGREPSPVLDEMGPRIAPLFHLGLLQPVRGRREDLPGWASVGIADTSPGERLEELLRSRPAPWPPTDLGDWHAVAEWWGEVRAARGEVNGGGLAEERIWAVWEELDARFRPWLRENFGEILTRSSARPLTVDKVAPFLAARLRRGQAHRILLIVLDGMGLAQWSIIRRAAGLRVVDASVVLALLPTITSVSRQAIFSGSLPMLFPDSIGTTEREGEHWKRFWAREMPALSEVSYARVSGAQPIPLGSAIVQGVVITAVDTMMHQAHLLGDVQLTASLVAWVRQGVLRSLVAQASRAGYEVWVTADHGNVEAVPIGSVAEGLKVEDAGQRVRWYVNETLREASAAPGLRWTPPGIPDDCFLVFAEGRAAYVHGTAALVTHGGMSLDEVVVPLARVEA